MEPENKIANNINQYFNNDGIMEKTVDRSNKIIHDLLFALRKHDVPITISRGIKTVTSVDKVTGVPYIFFQGEQLQFTIMTTPVDKFGNTGKSYLSEREYVELRSKVDAEMPELVYEIPKDQTEEVDNDDGEN